MDQIYQFYIDPLNSNNITYGDESPIFYLMNYKYNLDAKNTVSNAYKNITESSNALDDIVNDKYYKVKSKAPQGGQIHPKYWTKPGGSPNTRIGMADPFYPRNEMKPAVMPKSLHKFKF